jgi:hypothetical protein
MAQFRTGKDQYTIPVDVNVVGAVVEGTAITSGNRKTAICAGDFVKYTPATDSVNAYIIKATAAELAAKSATHIVALSDMVMNKNHALTEARDYRTSLLVGRSGSLTVAPVNKTTATKKVALYPILDWTDIIPDADGLDVLA